MHTEKWSLKTFPLKLEKALKNVKTDGPAIVLKRRAVAEKTAVWAVDIKLLSRQKGRLMPTIKMSLNEQYELTSTEKAEPDGGVNAVLKIRNVKVSSKPPMPSVEKEAVKTLSGFKVSANINARGKFTSLDPKDKTTKKVVKHVTNLLNLLDILPDTPLRPGQDYMDTYTTRTRMVGGGVLNTKFRMKYTFKGVMPYKNGRVAVIHAVFNAKGATDNASKAESNVISKGNGSALILLSLADGSVVKAEMHLSSLNRGNIKAKKDAYDFAQYFETHMIVNRKK